MNSALYKLRECDTREQQGNAGLDHQCTQAILVLRGRRVYATEISLYSSAEGFDDFSGVTNFPTKPPCSNITELCPYFKKSKKVRGSDLNISAQFSY